MFGGRVGRGRGIVGPGRGQCGLGRGVIGPGLSGLVQLPNPAHSLFELLPFGQRCQAQEQFLNTGYIQPEQL